MKFINSTFLVLILNLPNLIGIAHIFEDNHHDSCEELSVHFHKKEFECSTCDYLRISFETEIDQNHFTNISVSKNFTDSFVYEYLVHSIFFSFFDRRGPPTNFEFFNN